MHVSTSASRVATGILVLVIAGCSTTAPSSSAVNSPAPSDRPAVVEAERVVEPPPKAMTPQESADRRRLLLAELNENLGAWDRCVLGYVQEHGTRSSDRIVFVDAALASCRDGLERVRGSMIEHGRLVMGELDFSELVTREIAKATEMERVRAIDELEKRFR